MKKILLLSLLIGSTTAGAASFDCAKASSPDEKAICANRALNDKDVEMATKYQFLKGLFAMGGQGAMQDQQQAWLKERKTCGANVACLTTQYNKRLSALDAIYAKIDKPL
ncbi:periplasmic protein [Klebsiella michiganensis]|nr:periplasmic protein [Klebsiella michiganensis]